jgi:hypothetical protein
MPSGVTPIKSARIFDAAVFRWSRPFSAKSIVGHPHVHVPTTEMLASCGAYSFASADPLAISHSRRVCSSWVSGLRSGLMPKVIAPGCSVFNSDREVLGAICPVTLLPEPEFDWKKTHSRKEATTFSTKRSRRLPCPPRPALLRAASACISIALPHPARIAPAWGDR